MIANLSGGTSNVTATDLTVGEAIEAGDTLGTLAALNVGLTMALSRILVASLLPVDCPLDGTVAWFTSLRDLVAPGTLYAGLTIFASYKWWTDTLAIPLVAHRPRWTLTWLTVGRLTVVVLLTDTHSILLRARDTWVEILTTCAFLTFWVAEVFDCTGVTLGSRVVG